jgi:uncharacterized protein
MKVLLTGATGLVGSHIVKLLAERGVSINYYTRTLRPTSLEGGSAFLWNPDRLEWDPEALEGVTHVINLAGASIAERWTAAYKEEVVRSRVNSLKTLQLALEQRPQLGDVRVLSASAIGCYASDFDVKHSEHSEQLGNGFLAEVVQLWEEAAKALLPAAHSLCLLRIGIVLDRDQGALPKLLTPVKWGMGAPLGNGRQWQSWIHIDDLARLFVYLLDRDLGSLVNAVAPNALRQKELTTVIASTLKKPLWLPAVPEWVLKLILGEMSAVVLQSQHVVSTVIEGSDFKFQFNSAKEALEDLLTH